MNQSQIATMFRKAELERRAARRQHLLNEAKLLEEGLTPSELAAHRAAVKQIAEQDTIFRKEVGRTYWQTLWAAVRGKL